MGNIYQLTKLDADGIVLHPIHNSCSEEYAHTMFGLYLSDELVRVEDGAKPFIRNYRLHAKNPHSIEMALAYEINCPKCGNRLKQTGRCRNYHELGLYTCKHCNER